VGQYLWQRVSRVHQFKMKVCARAEYRRNPVSG
jgi:hypothetical protein